MWKTPKPPLDYPVYIKNTKSKNFYSHFSGVEHNNGNKKRCTPIKKGDMRFDPLADCILDNKDFKILKRCE